MTRPVGGNPPLPASLLAAAPSGARVTWVASGRDGYLLIQRAAPVRRWLLPDFLCGVVARTLAASGASLSSYAAGELDRIPQAERRRSAVVLLWDVDAGPSRRDAAAAGEAALVVEDRCVWAGLPWHVPTLKRGHVAVGSCRKWLGTGDGGWVMGLSRSRRMELAPPDAAHVASIAAAALLRRLRAVRDGAKLEAANVACADLAETSLGIPDEPRAMSQLGVALLASAGPQDGARRIRARLAGRIAALLGGSDRARPGAIGIRIVSPRRDALRAALARAGVYAPVHWPDGAWNGGASARAIAATTLTLPAPGDLTSAEERAYLRRLPAILKRFGAQPARLADGA